MPLQLDIDAHGRVIPRSDPVRRALADRAGRFVLLPSVGDLLIAQRTPAAGGAAEQPRCILAGDLAAFPIVDFIAFVHQSRLSGVLTVRAGGAERSIAFQDGEVRCAHSTAPGERLGEMAVRLGFATQAQIAEIAAADRPLGKALVDGGVLEAHELYRCLQEQVVAVFHAILLSTSGTFALVDGETERASAPLSVNTQSLLMDGIRRIDELSLLKARIPGPETVLRRRDPPQPVTLRPGENALLALVDGRRTVAAIATAAHLNEFDTTKILFRLAETGHVETVAAAPPAERIAAVAAGMSDLLRSIVRAVPAHAHPELLVSARTFLRDGSSRWAPLLRGLSVAEDGGIDPAAVEEALSALDPAALAAMDPSSSPARIALEALRDALLFWLFLAGGEIPCDVDEALGREVKQKLASLEAFA